MKFIIPLIVFFAIGGFLYGGLGKDPTHVPSPFIGKTAPEFTLPTLSDENVSFSPEQMRGKVWLFNIWGTWCPSCHEEHPVLVDLANQDVVEIVGLNYKDEIPKAKQWLVQLGNPYVVTAVDQVGRVGIDWGFYGAPETFVIDKSGVVRHKHVGPLSVDDIQNTILPLVEQLRANDNA